MSWAEDVLQKLDRRDRIEQQDSTYYRAFTQLLSRTVPEAAAIPYPVYDEAKVTQIAADRDAHAARVKELEATTAKLTERVSQLRLEIKEKNNQIEVVNNEHLALQMQLSVTEQKLEQLTQEHDALIKRWMAKAESDANMMNAALGKQQ
ncbi:hypothetical protein DIURU_005380 [Diutina rugosa]|uniref:Autophagy-related protein 16 domain-containing protein n=1 Tax=Diutina rugosa TaxID=5481 RepID=A0A642UDH3_DIURU|nr:uncharacterized protein DIURU_005380 [Diutina rugosa]KAA8897147.1 hypothetical protein DIURU_005380 [Diutina rugosa]